MQICTSPRQITTPLSHHSVFTGRMPILPPNQQRQSTEGQTDHLSAHKKRAHHNHAVFLIVFDSYVLDAGSFGLSPKIKRFQFLSICCKNGKNRSTSCFQHFASTRWWCGRTLKFVRTRCGAPRCGNVRGAAPCSNAIHRNRCEWTVNQNANDVSSSVARTSVFRTPLANA